MMEACPTQLLLKNLLHNFVASTGLKVSYSKSVMVHVNITDGKLQELATPFDCQKGSLPFTYLGMPLGTTKPNIQDFMPLMQRIEKRFSCTSMFLSQDGKLELANSVFSSSTIYYTTTLKLHKGVIKQLDCCRKHFLWRGSDLTLKSPARVLGHWSAYSKKQGGLGITNLSTHNEAMLLKYLHKLFCKADIPWVNLVWETYYSNLKLPSLHKKGFFWWRD
jgi:hypothetical protein